MKRSQAGTCGGYSLLEAIAALGIVLIAVSSLLIFLAHYAQFKRTGSLTAIAATVAQRHMEELKADPLRAVRLADGKEDGPQTVGELAYLPGGGDSSAQTPVLLRVVTTARRIPGRSRLLDLAVAVSWKQESPMGGREDRRVLLETYHLADY
jgi:type II secretory pathway pseudopilin PulG